MASEGSGASEPMPRTARLTFGRTLGTLTPRYIDPICPLRYTTMLDLAILGLLDEHDLHGYELRKRLGDLLGLRLAISFGSLYPALGRLEKAGLVQVVSSAPPAAAPR